MNIKDLSESLNIPQSKLKKICLELLGCIPAELTQDDELKVREAIASTTRALAAATDANGEMTRSQTATPTQTKIAEALGESIVRRLIGEYLASLQAEYKSQQFQLDTLQFELEQRFYNQLASYQQTTQNQSIKRIQKNASYFSLEGLKALPADNSDDDLLEQIASFMETFDHGE